MKYSGLNLTVPFIPMLKGFQDLALPMPECVEVRTYVMWTWKGSCGDSSVEPKD